MLQAKTEKSKQQVKSILDVCTHVEVLENGVHVSGYITYDQMEQIADYLCTIDKKNDLFEECWKAYRRKGVKKQAKDQWVKLSDKEKLMVMPHIKAYVSSREIQYQKDFERYLRDRVFKEVVYSNNQVIYDPAKASDNNTMYMPELSPLLCWNEYYKCYMYLGYFDGHISDGYEDDNRPDGASVTLNNGRGTIVWDSKTKKWIR